MAEASDSKVNRVELFAFAGLVDAINAFSTDIVSANAHFPTVGAVLALGGISALSWFALYAVAAIAFEDGAAEPVRPWDTKVAMAMFGLALVPLEKAAAAGLLLGGVFLLATGPARSRSYRIGAILLALTGPALWGMVCLKLFAPMLLGVDAQLAGWLAGLPVTGNIVGGEAGSWSIFIGSGCSSLHNISLVLLLWVTLVQLLRLRVTLGLILAGAGAVIAVATINIVRLSALATFPDHFALLHEGYGPELFGLGSLMAAGLVIGFGIVASPRSRA